MALRRSRVLLLILGLLLVVTLWRYVSVERDKRRIAAEYAQAQQMVQQLQEERAHLNEELVGARQTIEGQAGNLGSLQEELQGLQNRLDETVTELASLQREHEQLRAQNTSLSGQLSSVMSEKQQLEVKLSSLKELKLAIHDVKRKMWDERWADWRAHVEALKAADQEALALGNRGYLVRNGVATLGSREKLQVHVLEPQAQ